MNCGRTNQIDVAAYLADPHDAQWRDFAAHFPDCDECTEVLEAWTRLEQAVEASSTTAHPETAHLFAFAEGAGLSMGERDTVALHLEGCPECRSSLDAFAMLLQADGAAQQVGEVSPHERSPASLFERLCSRWDAWTEVPLWQPAVGLGAAAAATAVLWLASNPTDFGVEESSGVPLVERPVLPPSPSPARPPIGESESPVRPGVEGPADEAGPLLADRGGVPRGPSDEPKPVDPAPARPTPTPGAPSETPRGERTTWVLAMADLPAPDYRAPDDPFEWMRVSGAVRSGDGASRVELEALTPDHVAHTVSRSPTLYWYASDPIAEPVSFVWVEEETDATREAPLESPSVAGIQEIDLAALGIELETGALYHWYVTTNGDETGDGDEEITASGAIRRVGRSADLIELESGPRSALASGYAARGLWYDALAILGEAIDHAPDDERLRAHRADLLEQAGLTGAASYDRRRAGLR